MVAAAIGVSAATSLAGAAMTSSAAGDAAQTQADAANRSADMQNAQWQQTQANLRPFIDFGTGAINPLRTAMGYDTNWNLDPNNILNQTFKAPSANDAAATPGYQFTLDQGLRAVQNSAAARGLGTSGAAMKGAAGYATGLANSTYNDVFNRALQTFNTNYGSAANRVNRLNTIVGNGQNAAATNGSLGANAMSSIGDSLMSGANAAAAGRVGSANAIASGLNGVGSNALLYGMMSGPNNASGGSWGTSFNPNDTTTYFNNPAAYG
ncbi:hypothetical protein R6138_04376 [Ralstonia thomasii]|uniref:hypothetical protein n=1 Tax=Ralstonia thomasii TaxID=3058596 RepID=UPI0028F5B7B7|nr:hypothetical protein [Ralstonia sp. LMG 18095]CAJ0899812.1 hypothetical protein R6138_04376 [Ralstonia sp. LMG 18095]